MLARRQARVALSAPRVTGWNLPRGHVNCIVHSSTRTSISHAQSVVVAEWPACVLLVT